MSKHIKHGKTTKANFGNFGRFEIAIMGTPCSQIKKLSGILTKHLEGLKIAYADADHIHNRAIENNNPGTGNYLNFTDKISYRQIDYSMKLNRYQNNMLFNDCDLVLVNGNHFEASKQILIIDPRKPLNKKLHKITNPVMVLYLDTPFEQPSYLKDHIDLDIVPFFKFDDYEKIAAKIRKMLQEEIPILNGLILAGGKSLRMGRDKGMIEYFGKPHRKHLFEMLTGKIKNVFYSVRPDQANEFEHQPVILDSFSGLGPFGALLSAFREYPNDAWLVIATDLPLITKRTIDQLINGRNPSKMATAFYNPKTDFTEPLITIWEPKSYPVLLNFLSLGYSCPRKVLINSDIEVLNAENPDVLKNINDPESYEAILKLLKK